MVCVDCGKKPHLSDGSLGGDIGRWLETGDKRYIYVRCGICQTKRMVLEYLKELRKRKGKK